MKIVINKCYGGFGLSSAAIKSLIESKSSLIEKKSVEEYGGGNNPIGESKDVGDGFSTHGYFEGVLVKEGNVYFLKREYEEDIRDHEDLIKVVETLGKEANGRYGSLGIVEIPPGIDWEIKEYDGIEWIAECHRTWG